MRNLIAGGFAALVVVAAVFMGWQAVGDRLQPDEQTPDVPIDVLVAALEAGAADDVAAAVRSGGAELAAAVDTFASALTVDAWDVTRGPIAVDGAVASAPLTVALATDEVGTIEWETEVTATRVRGEWGIDATTRTLHPDLPEDGRVVVERNEPTRAPILDRDGEALTSHGAAQTIGIEPQRIINEERLFALWGELLPESYEDLEALLSRSDLRPSWFYPVVTISQERHDEVWPRLRSVPGVLARDAEDATPSAGQFASHLLGRVGQPTAEQAADLGVPDDAVVGLHGLERAFEEQLVGSAQVRALVVDDDGDTMTELGTTQDDASGPVATTLDRTVQEAVENALTGVSDEAAVVAVDTGDGAIRASASRPLTGYNRAWEGNYPPGDAFLYVTAEALLAGDVTLRQPTTCPAREAVVGAAFDAPRPAEETTVGRALAAGCDTTLAALAADLDPEGLLAAGERFGFGTAHDLPLAAATPNLPTPVDTTELVRAANGQARVLASPLHVATMVAAAAEGTWYAPHLLRDQDIERPSVALSPTATEDLQRLLALGGRRGGSAAGFAALGAGGVVGTAPVTGAETVHGWAVGAVDDLAFAVLVEDTGGDDRPARRIAERFLRELEALTR